MDMDHLAAMMAGRQGPFRQQYRCYSMMFMQGDRERANRGGKIILPPSALEDIARRRVTYPLMFTVTNPAATRTTHCGVLEFVAEEGRVYMPLWMMQNLFIADGDIITVETVDLPVATFSKVQPLTDDFLDISDPKAVLENALRDFSCLTEGDTIAISYNNKDYQISVLEVKPPSPHRAVSIVECDMQLDFEAPPGYEERQREKMAAVKAAEAADRSAAEAQEASEQQQQQQQQQAAIDEQTFYGTGHRLDGKNIKGTESSSVEGAEMPPDHVLHSLPDDRKKAEALRRAALDQRIRPFTFGKLTFRKAKPPPVQAGGSGDMDEGDDDDEESTRPEPFSGQGHALKPAGTSSKASTRGGSSSSSSKKGKKKTTKKKATR